MPGGSGKGLHSIDFRKLARDPFVMGVTGLLVVAATLRFSTLDLQSYYTDEAYTVWLVQKSPVDMVHGIARTESTPPLYYGLGWVWSRVFGTSEIGLRSLSALFGTATVLVAYLAGARLLSRRAGLIVAALAAVSPFMVWYSQEARSYALFTFLATLSIYLYARVRADARAALVVAWAVVCTAAIWTHYFAVYVVATEAMLLLSFVPRTRRTVSAALLGIAVASVPVAALAIHQQQTGNSSWIARLPLGGRFHSAATEFLGGHYPIPHVRVVVAALALLVVVLLASSRSRVLTPGLAEPVLLGIGILVLPLVAAALGKDYWLSRNVIPAWICAALIIAASLAYGRYRWLTWSLAAALVALSLVSIVETLEHHEFQRADWRGLARCLGAPRRGRAVAFRSEAQVLVLGIYRPEKRRLGDRPELVDELDIVDFQHAPADVRVPSQFAAAGTACETTIPVLKFVAQTPVPVSSLDLLPPSRASEAQVHLDL